MQIQIRNKHIGATRTTTKMDDAVFVVQQWQE